MNENPQNPNDFKVVSFHNSEDFGFTPEMGCMFNGIAINGNQGGPGINIGETMVLPYHIAHRIATNLAKHVMTRAASSTPQLDAQGQPIIKAIWNDVELERMKNSYLTELYSENKPAKLSETDILLAKLEDYRKLTDEKFAQLAAQTVAQETKSETILPPVVTPEGKITYQDKAEVLAELEKRGIKHDKRSNKETLEALLA